MAILDIAQAIIGAVIGLAQLIVGTIIGVVSAILNVATGSRESALAFAVLFMIIVGALVWFTYGQTNVDRPSSISAAIFGNVSASNAPLNTLVGNESAELLAHAELAKFQVPEGASNLGSTRVDLTADQVRGWYAARDSGCASLASAQGPDNYVWSAVLLPARDSLFVWTTVSQYTLGGYFDETCGFVEVSDNQSLVSTDIANYSTEVAQFALTHRMCSDSIYLHDAKAWWGMVTQMDDCWGLRDNRTFERIYVDQPADEWIPGAVIMNAAWVRGVKNTAILPDVEHVVTVDKSGPLSPVTQLWFTLRFASEDAVAGSVLSEPIVAFYSFVQSAAYALAMILITLLGCVAIIAISKVL